MVAFLLTVALALLGLPSTSLAGVQDAPFPTFSDGKASQLALLIPTAIKINNLDTEVICTNLTPAAVDIGLEVFDQTGTRGNTIGSGNGALLDVAPGATVTITTGQTKVKHPVCAGRCPPAPGHTPFRRRTIPDRSPLPSRGRFILDNRFYQHIV